MSRVTCHDVSHVTCHVSRVTCHMSHVFFCFFFWQSGEAYRWRVCYQRGLPRLVSHHSHITLFPFACKSSVAPVLTGAPPKVRAPGAHLAALRGHLAAIRGHLDALKGHLDDCSTNNFLKGKLLLSPVEQENETMQTYFIVRVKCTIFWLNIGLRIYFYKYVPDEKSSY